MTDHLAVIPDGDCRRLRHPDPVALTLPTGDHLDACPLCTIAYRRVLDELGDARYADAFVERLRAETEPFPGHADPADDHDHDDNDDEERT